MKIGNFHLGNMPRLNRSYEIRAKRAFLKFKKKSGYELHWWQLNTAQKQRWKDAVKAMLVKQNKTKAMCKKCTLLKAIQQDQSLRR
jgi:hypothetical protein